MLPSKVWISKDAAGVLRALAQRSRLKPNLLARMALATSLELGRLEVAGKRTLSGGQEFNTYTLLGVDQEIYLALVEIVEGETDEVLDIDTLIERMVAHIERGITQIAVRVRSPADAARLLAGAAA